MKLLTALAITAVMFASSASAFDPDDLQKLKDTGDCYRCDLRAANLMWADLSGANLREADISGAKLAGANLLWAKLSGADLSSANLSGANLSMTPVNGTILCNTIMPDGSVIYSGC